MAYIDQLREAQKKWRNVGTVIDRSGAYVNSRDGWNVKPYEGEVSQVGTLAAISPLTGGLILFGGRGAAKTELGQTVLYLTTGMTPDQVQHATYTGKQSVQGNSYSVEMRRETDSSVRDPSREEKKQGIRSKQIGAQTEKIVLVPSDFLKSPGKLFDEIGELSPAEQVYYRRLLQEGVVELPDGSIHRIPQPWAYLATTNRGVAETVTDKNIDIAFLDRFPTAVEVPQTGGFADRYSLGSRPFQRIFETDIKKVLTDMGYPGNTHLLPESLQEVAQTIALIDQMPVEDDLRYFADFLLAANSTCLRATNGDKVSGTKPIGDKSEAYRCFECPYNERDALSKMLTSGFSYRAMQYLLRTARAVTFYLDGLDQVPTAKMETGESVAPSVMLHRMLPTSVALESTVADSRTGLAYFLGQKAALEYNKVQPVVSAMIGGMLGVYDLTADNPEGNLVRDALRRVDEVILAENERRAGRIEHPVTERPAGDLVIQFHYAPILRDLVDGGKAAAVRSLATQISAADAKDPQAMRKLEQEIDRGEGRKLSLASKTHIKRNLLYPKFEVNKHLVG